MHVSITKQFKNIQKSMKEKINMICNPAAQK